MLRPPAQGPPAEASQVLQLMWVGPQLTIRSSLDWQLWCRHSRRGRRRRRRHRCSLARRPACCRHRAALAAGRMLSAAAAAARAYSGPYPTWPAPTPEQARQVAERLATLHGWPSARRARGPQVGCEERRSVLDSLVRTLLSQNTTDATSGRAFAALKQRFPSWQAVLRAPAADVADAIRVGGWVGGWVGAWRACAAEGCSGSAALHNAPALLVRCLLSSACRPCTGGRPGRHQGGPHPGHPAGAGGGARPAEPGAPARPAARRRQGGAGALQGGCGWRATALARHEAPVVRQARALPAAGLVRASWPTPLLHLSRPLGAGRGAQDDCLRAAVCAGAGRLRGGHARCAGPRRSASVVGCAQAGACGAAPCPAFQHRTVLAAPPCPALPCPA